MSLEPVPPDAGAAAREVQLSRSLFAAETDADVARAVCSALSDAHPDSAVGVLYLKNNTFHWHAQAGVWPAALQGSYDRPLMADVMVLHDLMTRGIPMFAETYAQLDRLDSALREQGVRSLAVLPLMGRHADTRDLAIVASFDQLLRWDPHEHAHLTLLARLSGHALERLLDERHLQGLLTSIQHLAGATHPAGLFEVAVTSLTELLVGCDVAAVLERTAQESFTCVARAGISGGRFGPGDHVSDSELTPFFERIPPQEGSGSTLCLPIMSYRRLLGVIWLENLQWPHAFTLRDHSIAHAFAQQLGITLHQTYRRVRLDSQAHQDELTGLPNRRAFQSDFARALEALTANNTPVAVVMMDLNQFKRVNDIHGHEAGDATLIEVASRLLSAQQEGHRVYRWGGDEFVALVPSVNRAQAQQVADAYRHGVGVLNVSGIPVSLSAGVAVAPEDDTDALSLIRRADHAMYRMKETHRSVTSPDSGLT